MPVNYVAPDAASLRPVPGVRLGVAAAQIRKPGRNDLTVLLLDAGTQAAGVFTQNRFCAAPVQVCREHLATGQAVRALVINTGNANAGTGAAQKRFCVKTPATCVPASSSSTVRSSRPGLRTLAAVTPRRTPGTGSKSAAAGAA